jgi:hypothetical protein
MNNALSASASTSGSTTHPSSSNLESLKFPFLLPQDERPGRRGIFTLKSLINPKEGGRRLSEDVPSGPGARQRDEKNGVGGSRNPDATDEIMEEEGSEEGIGPGTQSLHQKEQDLLSQDPIEAGVLSVEDARTLFKLYMDEMSVMNCLLDKRVHTHGRLRSSYLTITRTALKRNTLTPFFPFPLR